jgi:hypothetical protein
MENPQFVSSSWFIGLIGLDFEFPEIKHLNLDHVRARTWSCSTLRPL